MKYSVHFIIIIMTVLSACRPVKSGEGVLPMETPMPEDIPAVGVVVQLLRQQLAVRPEAVTVKSVEDVVWNDTCLGIESPSQGCAESSTPGYKIILEVKGDLYEYHTDADGRTIRLASAPQPDVGESLLRWESPGAPCQTAVFSARGISFGECGGVLITSRNLSHTRRLLELINQYSAFSVETPGGRVTLKGRGSIDATDSEKRAIAEWASLQFQVAQAGRAGASWGLALAWHREGGAARRCDELTVHLDGSYSVFSCSPDILGNYQSRLSSAQLDVLYSLVDSLKNFEFKDEPYPLAADYLVVRFAFSGLGEKDAVETDIRAVNKFADELIASARVPVSGGGLPQAVLATISILAANLSIPDVEVQVVQFESMDWPDSCLAVYNTGEECAQVITTGYRVFLVAQGLLYEFRTDVDGNNIRLFGAPQAAPTPGTGG